VTSSNRGRATSQADEGGNDQLVLTNAKKKTPGKEKGICSGFEAESALRESRDAAAVADVERQIKTVL